MREINFFNGRWVYEAELAELQDNMEKAVSDMLPEFWGRVIEGFKVSTENNVIKLSQGVAVGKEGQTILLEEEFIFPIPEITITNGTLVLGIAPQKVIVGEMTDPDNNLVPANFKDGCQVYIRLHDNDTNEDTILYPPDTEQVFSRATPKLTTAQEGLEYFEKMKKTGSTYAGELKSGLIDSLMWRESFNREGEVWSASIAYEYLQNQIAFFKRKQGIEEAGSIFHHFIPNDKIAWLVENIEKETRWRLLNGQAMPEGSVFKKLGQNNILDLKNKFIRVWDGDQVVGRHQEDAMQRLTGSFFLHEIRHVNTSGIFQHYNAPATYAGHTDVRGENTTVTFDNARQAKVADENRPKNVMLPLFILT